MNWCGPEAVDASLNPAFVPFFFLCAAAADMQSQRRGSRRRTGEMSAPERGSCLPQIRRFEPWPPEALRSRVNRPPDVIWSTFFVWKWSGNKQKKPTTLVSHLSLHLSEFRVNSEFPCKDTCIWVITTLGIIIISPSSPVNISWFYSILFVLVCDESASENTYQLFTFAQQAHQNWSDQRNARYGWYYRPERCSTLFVLS